MPDERRDLRGAILAGLLLTAALALSSCVTGPDVVQRRVLVCVTDWVTGVATCHYRRCDYRISTGDLDCLNKPVIN